MKKIFLFVALYCLYLLPSSAQDSLRQQTIYLIDGSILRARILEENTDYTRIKIINGDVLLLNNELINNVVDEDLKGKKMIKRSALHTRGSYNIISLGLLAGRDAQLEQGLILGSSIFHYVRGYQFNQWFGMGGGIGFDLYDHAHIPLYLDFRGNVNLKSLTLFYSLQGGYSFTNHDFGGDQNIKNSGGLMLYPAVGIKIPTLSKANVLLEFGYRNQWASREYIWWENKDEIIYRRYAFRVGFEF